MNVDMRWFVLRCIVLVGVFFDGVFVHMFSSILLKFMTWCLYVSKRHIRQQNFPKMLSIVVFRHIMMAKRHLRGPFHYMHKKKQDETVGGRDNSHTLHINIGVEDLMVLQDKARLSHCSIYELLHSKISEIINSKELPSYLKDDGEEMSS